MIGTETFAGAPPSVPETARSAFTRPPVTALPASSGLASTEPMIAFLMSSAVRPGRAESTSAATPAVFGLAIEVPWRYWYAGDR